MLGKAGPQHRQDENRLAFGGEMRGAISTGRCGPCCSSEPTGTMTMASSFAFSRS
jgi:hypothetical protein